MNNFNLQQRQKENNWVWILEFVGKKPKNLEEAWELTLEKWQFLIAKEILYIIEEGEKTCGLCMLFREKEDCPRCPVKTFTGLEHCKETPYQRFLYKQATSEEVYNFLLSVKHGNQDTVSEA